MAKTRCYRIDFDLFPAAIGRRCANVALNSFPLLPLGLALFSFRSSFFSRLGLRLCLGLGQCHRLCFLVAFDVVVVFGATCAPCASCASSVGATCPLWAIHQRRQLQAVRFQHQITAQHAQWDALWRFKWRCRCGEWIGVEWRDSMCDSFGCGLRLRIRIGDSRITIIYEQNTKYLCVCVCVCGLDIYRVYWNRIIRLD